MTEEDQADPGKLFATLRELHQALKGLENGAKFTDAHGVNSAPIDSYDLAVNAKNLAVKFERYDWGSLTEEDTEKFFLDLANKLRYTIDTMVPQVHASPHVPAAIMALLYSIDLQISALVTADVVEQSLKLPQNLRREVNQARRRLESAVSSSDDVVAKIETINSSFAAAQQLPASQSDLEQALRETERARDAILQSKLAATKNLEETESSKELIRDLLGKAKEVMARVDEAYRSSTSDGLARAFSTRAKILNRSMYYWAAALLLALAAATFIGWQRFPAILDAATKTASGQSSTWGPFLIQVIVASLSLGAPVWLGWVSTKQLGQRFRLSEDYAYKASLAAAYEGYRAEAVNIDPLMQAQLFSIALSRLDEIPLRLVEQEVAGSPLHELIRSSEFERAIAAVPTLKDRLMVVLSRKGNVETDAIAEPKRTGPDGPPPPPT